LRAGDRGPYTLSFATKPNNVSQAALQLQTAVRAIDPSDPLFARSRVLALGSRLVVLAGAADEALRFEPTDSDEATVAELGLEPQQVRPVTALLSGQLSAPPAFTTASPQVSVRIGPIGPRTLNLASAYANLNALASGLQGLLRAADPAPVFAYATVVVSEGRILIVPDLLGEWPRAWLRVDLQAASTFALSGETSLLGNVALASHGETVKEETVGDGDPSEPFQLFTLKKAPLTYVPSAAATGGESSLELRVNGKLWQEVDSLYGCAATDSVYVTRVDEEGKIQVRFGDGINGARPPAGRGNILARYRQGLGLDGRVGAGALRNPLDRPKGLKGVDNPEAAEGGADPETLEEAQNSAPATVRTFGRAVSLQDFEDLLKEGGEVAKAKATWVWAAGQRAAHVTVGAQEGGTFSDTALARIHAGITAQRDPNRRLLLDNYSPLPVLIGATLILDGAYVASEVAEAAQEALEEAFSFENRAFGEPVHLSDIHALLQGVTGVTAVDVDRLLFKRPETMSEADFDDFLDQRGVTRNTDGSVRPLQQHLRIYPARPAGSGPPWVLAAEQATIEVPGEDIVLLTSGGLPD
jgi:hypothetical protein